MPTKTEILDLYFMDARYKLLDIAAYLDRLERHDGEADFRHPAFLSALAAMQDPPEGLTRTQEVHPALSAPSPEPAEAASIQFAYGAPDPGIGNQGAGGR